MIPVLHNFGCTVFFFSPLNHPAVVLSFMVSIIQRIICMNQLQIYYKVKVFATVYKMTTPFRDRSLLLLLFLGIVKHCHMNQKPLPPDPLPIVALLSALPLNLHLSLSYSFITVILCLYKRILCISKNRFSSSLWSH